MVAFAPTSTTQGIWQLEGIYIGYYGRAVDASGYNYWQNEYNARVAGTYRVNGVTQAAQSAADAVASIASSFGAATQAETIALYPFLGTSGVTFPTTDLIVRTQVTSFVTTVYQNLFNRAPDVAGLAYWVGQITSGRVSTSQAILAIENAAGDDNSAQSLADKAVLNNKIAVSDNFLVSTSTAGIGVSGTVPASVLAQARAILVGVDGTAASVTTAATAQTNWVATGAGTPGTIFNLTTGSDVGAGFTGGAGADNFSAVLTATSQMTLNSGDVLDGGLGADTLTAQINSAVTVTPTLRSIESVSVNFSAAGTLSLSGATGVTQLESNGSTDNATFSNISSAATALRVSNTGTNSTFTYTTAAVAGAADAATLTLSNVSAGTVTMNGIETVTINSVDAANTLTSLVDTSATSLKITGNQALTLTNSTVVPATVTTIDASGMTTGGSVNLAVSAATTAVTGSLGADRINITSAPAAGITVNAGLGNDTVVATATTSITGDTLTGGGGTDTLAIGAAIAETYAVPAPRIVTGFSNLTLMSAGTSGATLTTSNVLDGNTGDLTAASPVITIPGTGGAYTIATGANTAATVNIAGNTLISGGTVTVSSLGGALTVSNSGTGTADTLTIANSGAATVTTGNVFNAQNLTSTGYETVTINTGAGSNLNATAQTIGTVTVTASTGGTSSLTVRGGNAVSVGAVTAVSINASALTGTFTQTAAAATGTTSITGSLSAISTLIGALATAGTLTGGNANDVITGGNLADTLVGGAGNDTLNGGLGADRLTGGTGADTFVIGANAVGSSSSTASASDVITDFLSGTDKVQIAQTITAFIGNFANFSQGSAAAAADGRGNLAFFVSGENNLYVIAATAGTLAANGTDTVVTLTGVTALTQADLSLGAQGAGSSIALTASAATVNATTNTNASGVATVLDDGISTTAAFLANSTINGLAGNDTLTVSTALGTFTMVTAGAAGAAVSNVENFIFSAGTTGTVTMNNDAGITVTNGSSSAASTIVLGSGLGQSFTTASTALGIDTVTLGAAGQRVTGGSGNDVFNATNAFALGSSFTGGSGSDTLNITTALIAQTFGTTAVTGGAIAISSIETLSVVGGSTITITPDVAMTVAFDNAAAANTIAGTGNTITITNGALAQNLTLSGTSNFVDAALITGTITNTATGTVSVAVGATGTVSSTTAITVNATAATGHVAIQNNGNFTITGFGTGAGGAEAIVEAATHTTGSLTVTTASTVANAVTGDALGTGTLTVNQGGTGTTTIATGGHAIATVVSSAANSTTISGLGVLNYSVSGTAAAHTIISTTTGAAGDTVVGGAAIDTVTLGVGADRFTTGGGADVVNITTATDTGIAAGLVAGGTVANLQVFNTSGFDVITGAGTGLTINTTQTGANSTTATAYAIVRNGGTSGAATSNDMFQLTGSYNSATNQFTVDTGGSSTLLGWDSTGILAGGTYVGVVLVGYVDTGAADTWIAGGTTGATWLVV